VVAKEVEAAFDPANEGLVGVLFEREQPMPLSHHAENHLGDFSFYIIFVFEGNGETENKKRNDFVKGLLAGIDARQGASGISDIVHNSFGPVGR